MARATKPEVGLVQVGLLVQDLSLYPRQKVNSFQVHRFIEAIKADIELPPVVADKVSLRIIDGFHRVNAWIQTKGSAADIPVLLKEYKDETAMYTDAVKLNASHGLAFSVFDIGRILIQASLRRIPRDEVCNILNITSHRAEKILRTVRPIAQAAADRGDIPGIPANPTLVPVKKGLPKLLEKESLGPKEAAINKRWLGLEPIRYATDLLGAIEANAINYGVDLLYILERLRNAINTVLEAHKSEAV